MKYRVMKVARSEEDARRHFSGQLFDQLLRSEAIIPVPEHADYLQAFQEKDDCYMILQLREDAQEKFMPLSFLQKKGKKPNSEHYEAVYVGGFPMNLFSDKTLDIALESLYTTFNVDHLIPDDFFGHSLSVSDIIVLKIRGKISYHYVDSIGFHELTDFA